MIPVILCGGVGKRLWPLSTQELPKPFHALAGPHTLLQATMLRCKDPPFSGRIHVVAHRRHAELVRAQARTIGIAVQLVLECETNDSCAAALAGAIVVAETFPDETIAILAADQHIPDGAAWTKALHDVAAAKFDGFVLLGIRPTFPASSYGYVQGGESYGTTALRRAVQFVEKPSPEKAGRYKDEGWLWNSGNFIVPAKLFLEIASRTVPAMASDVFHAVQTGQRVDDSLHLNPMTVRDWAPVSLDRAILEYADEIAVLPVDFSWSDVGTWDEVQRLNGDQPCYVHSSGLEVRVIGLDDVIVVSTPQGVLVTKRGQADHLKNAVKNS